jgi:hypothetical protein
MAHGARRRASHAHRFILMQRVYERASGMSSYVVQWESQASANQVRLHEIAPIELPRVEISPAHVICVRIVV